MKSRSLFILVLLGTAFQADAQRRSRGTDSTIKGATIEIIQSYKPEVKKAAKPELSADLPPADTTRAAFNYEVPQQTLSYTYSSFPLKPLALGTDSLIVPFANYLKVGLGNLSTILLDGSYTGLKGPDYETNFHISHLSQSGHIQNQKSSLSELEANGTLHRAGNAWHGSVEAKRNQYRYYGYNHSQFDYGSDSVKQAFTGLRFNLDMKNEMEGYKGFDYHPSAGLSFYGDRYGASERTVSFAAPVSYAVDSALKLHFGINGTFTQFYSPTINSRGNNIFQITPGLSFNTRGINGRVGFYPTFGVRASYLLPDIYAAFALPNTQFNFFGGYQASLRQNTYEQLSTRNPYMHNFFALQQTRTDELFGGIKSNIGNHVSFTGKVSWWKYNNLPLFINDTTSDGKQFNVIYDNRVNAISLDAAIRYQIANTFSVGLGGTFTNFYNSSFARVWQEPSIRFRGDMMITPLPKLNVTAYLSIMDGIYALEKGNHADKLPAIIDLGGSAEYLIIPRLSAFLNIDNLLNNKYQRWNGYDAYGFNIYGGVRLKF